jgi:hypothetical protein
MSQDKKVVAETKLSEE